MTQKVFDKHGQLVKEYDDRYIKGRRFIVPVRLPMTARSSDFNYPEIWRHEGGRVEFESTNGGATWHEVTRKYEEWYHNPWTGETWGRRKIRPEFQEEILEWEHE